MRRPLLAGLALLCACPQPEPDPGPEPNLAAEDWSGDLVHAELDFDLDEMTATATLQIATDSGAASLEADGLEVDWVRSGDVDLEFDESGGRLDIGLPEHEGVAEVTVGYGFEVGDRFEGLMDQGSTLTWPYFCGNLFPCRSDPADGMTFGVDVTGAPVGQTTVAGSIGPAGAPAYQLAWATGEYTELELGTTDAGTALSVWYAPGSQEDAEEGTADLVAVFDWLEQTLGPYPFGDRAGSVQVDWGAGAHGGMEHHPFWHISGPAMGDISVHTHEAAHGWFGGGIRLACWEDLVLSEGTASYLTARAIGQAIGPEAEEAVWDGYEGRLAGVFLMGDKVVLPDGCGDIDVLDDGLFGDAVYMKGAWFWRQVAELIGADALDEAFAGYFAEHSGGVGRMGELVAFVEVETGEDLSTLVHGWLLGTGDPRE